MTQLTFGSLFAGIGGFDLGFERAGMVCKWQVEIDDYASKVLAKHWPNVHRERDIRECGKLNLESVDVICGGFPCQDISWAGQGAGLHGERSGLWHEFARLIGEIRPSFVIVENSAALLHRGMGDVLGSLAAIGYDAELHCISASDLGAPHSRERLWLVAYPEGQRPGQLRWLGRAAESEGIRDIHWPEHEPPNERVVVGLPDQVDRVTALGNALLPQIPELIGRAILEARAAA